VTLTSPDDHQPQCAKAVEHMPRTKHISPQAISHIVNAIVHWRWAFSWRVLGLIGQQKHRSDEAREITDRIKTHLDDIWELIKLTYNRRAWIALGYASWDDYTATEFDTSHLRVPLEEHGSVVSSLSAKGMSTRAIAAATGMSKDTVHRALQKEEATVSDETVPSSLAEKRASKNKGKVKSHERVRPAKTRNVMYRNRHRRRNRGS
jgi:hypothetical protein